jgi:hypothetical protein
MGTPVGMTIHIWVWDASAQEKLSSRKKSQALGMTIYFEVDDFSTVRFLQLRSQPFQPSLRD